MLKLGAKGAISVTANVCPQACADQDRFLREGKVKEAEALHQKLLPLHSALFFETNPIPVKAALAMMGLIEEEYRLPLVKMGEGNRARLKAVLKELNIL
jgi:4-hydroxy-tetrahydrodipicolinate synthase